MTCVPLRCPWGDYGSARFWALKCWMLGKCVCFWLLAKDRKVNVEIIWRIHEKPVVSELSARFGRGTRGISGIANKKEVCQVLLPYHYHSIQSKRSTKQCYTSLKPTSILPFTLNSLFGPNKQFKVKWMLKLGFNNVSVVSFWIELSGKSNKHNSQIWIGVTCHLLLGALMRLFYAHKISNK